MKYIVKEESLKTFFDIKENDFRHDCLFPPRIIMPIRKDLSVGTTVVFEIADRTRKTGVDVQMNLEYTVNHYDSVSIILIRNETTGTKSEF